MIKLHRVIAPKGSKNGETKGFSGSKAKYNKALTASNPIIKCNKLYVCCVVCP